MKKSILSILKVLGFTLLTVFAQILFSVPFTLVFSDVIAALGGTFIGSIFVIKTIVPNAKKVFKININKNSFLKGVSLGVISFVTGILISLALPVGGMSDTTAILTQQSGIAYFITSMFAVFGAPITEELLFRGAFRTFFKKNEKWLYILSTSIVFGLLHLQSGDLLFNLAILLTTGFVGSINAYVYWNTDDITLPILSHIVYNFIVFSIATL